MDLADQIDLVCKDTIDILTLLAEKAHAFQLPSAHPQLDDYRARLLANSYQVLVVGEAKRGKSSFVNALIGRKLVPTDVDIATCQIFRISHSDREAYRVRFIDGTAREISVDDLPRYGSQIVVESAGVSNWHEVIHWLEIDAPTRFMPKNIHLIDTPGLGSLYAAHAQITQRFMPFADAVIFVLDSNQPILQQELEFIETIVNITPDIFFVQTKIDQHKREDWQKLLSRNEEILHTRFPQHLSQARIFPISNLHLLKAGLAGGGQVDELYLRISRYSMLDEALQRFLFRAAGWKRAAEAVQLAESYYVFARSVLEERLVAIQEKSVHRQREIQQHVQQRKNQFDTDWSERGQQQQEVKNQLHRIMRMAKRSLHESLQEDGEIELVEQEKIEKLKSVGEAKQYNAVLNDRIIDATLAVWRQVYEKVERDCSEVLAPFLQGALSLYLDREINVAHIPVRNTKALTVKSGWLTLMQSAGEETQNALQIASSLLSLPTVGPLATATQVVTLVTAGSELIRTVIQYSSSPLEDVKKQLRDRLRDILASVQQHFFGIELAIDDKSFIDDFFAAIEDEIARQMRRTALAASSDAQLGLEWLEQETRLGEQARLRNLEQVKEQIESWALLLSKLTAIQQELETLDAANGVL